MNLQLHIYSVERFGDPPADVENIPFTDLEKAKREAKKAFRRPGVYKVKLWDLDKGPVIPNRYDAPGLIYELV